MNIIGKAALGFLAICFSFDTISSFAFGRGATAAVPFAVSVLLWLWFFRDVSFGEKRRIKEMTAEANDWLATLRSSGKPPAVDTGSMMVPRDEVALLAYNSAMHELSADKSRHYLGTRIKIGSMPIYMGSSSGSHSKHFRLSDSGKFVVTNKKLYFLGASHTLVYKIEDVLGVTPTLCSVMINASSRVNPVILQAKNPILVSAVIRSLHDGSIAISR